MISHPFIVGERYADRRGEYIVREIRGHTISIEYLDSTRAECDISTKARIYRNILAEHRFLHPIQTEGYFYFLGFLAVNAEFNAEVPPQSRASFEEQYAILTGHRPTPHSEGYFPITIQTTWDKWAPELRIIFPLTNLRFDIPPEVEIRAGSDIASLRINNNQFWRILVRIGFRLGTAHRVDIIRESIPNEFRPAFQAGMASMDKEKKNR